MKAAETINEAEARAKVYEALTAKGIKVTKTLVDQIMDTQTDLAIAGLVKGMGIKIQGLGTLAVHTHEERTRKVPVKDENGDYTYVEITSPAGRHIKLETSEKLLNELNKTL